MISHLSSLQPRFSAITFRLSNAKLPADIPVPFPLIAASYNSARPEKPGRLLFRLPDDQLLQIGNSEVLYGIDKADRALARGDGQRSMTGAVLSVREKRRGILAQLPLSVLGQLADRLHVSVDDIRYSLGEALKHVRAHDNPRRRRGEDSRQRRLRRYIGQVKG
jgi:hypothetical protein